MYIGKLTAQSWFKKALPARDRHSLAEISAGYLYISDAIILHRIMLDECGIEESVPLDGEAVWNALRAARVDEVIEIHDDHITVGDRYFPMISINAKSLSPKAFDFFRDAEAGELVKISPSLEYDVYHSTMRDTLQREYMAKGRELARDYALAVFGRYRRIGSMQAFIHRYHMVIGDTVVSFFICDISQGMAQDFEELARIPTPQARSLAKLSGRIRYVGFQRSGYIIAEGDRTVTYGIPNPDEPCFLIDGGYFRTAVARCRLPEVSLPCNREVSLMEIDDLGDPVAKVRKRVKLDHPPLHAHMRDGYLYLTDGHVLHRIPMDSYDSYQEDLDAETVYTAIRCMRRRLVIREYGMDVDEFHVKLPEPCQKLPWESWESVISIWNLPPVGYSDKGEPIREQGNLIAVGDMITTKKGDQQ